MANVGEADFGTVYYRSKDSIKNLNIKVTLEKVTSTSVVPQAVIEQRLGDRSVGTEMREIRRQQEMLSQKESEEYIFQWQEKVFSKREFTLYSQEHNCEDVTEKKYHQDVMRIGERPTKRLFSYVNHDRFTSQKECIQPMTTAPSEKPSMLAEKVSTVRRRRTAASSRLVESDSVIPKVNIVDPLPTEESRKRNHVIITPEQTMMVMADLCPRDREPIEDDEYVLCTIKVDSNGVISMKPNFNKDKKPYRIETGSLGKEVFQYTLENCSKQMSSLEKQREMKMYKELYSRHADYLKSIVGIDFERPPIGVLRLVVYGEIISARNFELDDLFVSYIIDVPPQETGWKVDQNRQVAGVTQTCSTKVKGRDNVAYFSFPFEIEMFYKKPVCDKEEEDQMIKAWPKVYFEICSFDSWQRFCPEGYCAVVVPNCPGKHEVTMNCWRPVGPSIVSNMRRFFIGGAPELEDLSYTYKPTTFEGSRMSRYGFKTESTGELNVTFNVMLQSQSFRYSAAKNKEAKKHALMTQLGSAVDYTQIRAVLDAFSKAHDRMRLARENVLSDLKTFTLDEKEATEAF